MSQATQLTRAYPWSDVIDGNEITFRLMTHADRGDMLSFAQALRPEDLMFLRLDITRPEVIDHWIEHIEAGNTVTVLACENGKIVGYGTLHFNETWWTHHLGQVRILVQSDRRKLGLGRRLAVEIFQLAREKKLTRIFVQMAADQPYVRQLFEDLGFRAEALLTDWVMDRNERTHDLLIMSHYVDDFGS
ncbi:MAG: GNAT family N-acetyltransferase [Candidatus Hydrogenedentes bacterium]|nr:GNAT family N-acetyltransferase [Candidatus Hydrogenedentota bacterium]